MYPNQECGFFLGADPRISPSRIAANLGLSRTTVQTRIRDWVKEGFLLGWDVRPNLRLLGVGDIVQPFWLPALSDVETMLTRLEEVDGILCAVTLEQDLRAQAGEHGIRVHSVQDHPEAVARRQRLLRRLAGGGRADPPTYQNLPACDLAQLSAVDWQILRVLMDAPHIPLGALAARLRVSRKTVSRHYNRLLDTHSIIYNPDVDWSRVPAADFFITCTGAGTRNQVTHLLKTRFGHYLRNDVSDLTESGGLIGRDADPRTYELLYVTVPIRAPVEAHLIAGQLGAITGVVRVERAYFVRYRSYRQWVRQRVDEKVEASRVAAHGHE